MSRLGAGIVDAYLEHRKAALQFDRTVFCAFLGAELGLEPSVYLDGKTGFRQFDRAAGHSKIRFRWRHFSHLVTVSPARPASLFLWLWKEEYAHQRFVRPPALRGRPWPREDTLERRSLLQPPEEAWQWEREATAEQDNRIARVMMA